MLVLFQIYDLSVIAEFLIPCSLDVRPLLNLDYVPEATDKHVRSVLELK